MRAWSTGIAVSGMSVAAGVATLFLLAPFLSRGLLVYSVVGVVVLSGWALRTYWTRELRGPAIWRGLFTALATGILMAVAYLWITERLLARPASPRDGIRVVAPRHQPFATTSNSRRPSAGQSSPRSAALPQTQ